VFWLTYNSVKYRRIGKLLIKCLVISGTCVFHGCVAVQHRQLLTVFALSMRYQASDVSLAVSCGILPRLLRLCDTAVLRHQLTGHARLSDVGCILATASMRLLQILAITSRWAFYCLLLFINFDIFYNTAMFVHILCVVVWQSKSFTHNLFLVSCFVQNLCFFSRQVKTFHILLDTFQFFL